MLLGNLDEDIRQLFRPGTAILLPLLGWNIGQGLNLVAAFQSGLAGLLLVLIYYLVNAYQYPLDKLVLKNSGLAAIAMASVAGISISTPAVIAQSNPALQEYVDSATAQLLTAVIITAILTPLLANYQARKKKS